jgi:prolyl 4-hydroxylase
MRLAAAALTFALLCVRASAGADDRTCDANSGDCADAVVEAKGAGNSQHHRQRYPQGVRHDVRKSPGDMYMAMNRGTKIFHAAAVNLRRLIDGISNDYRRDMLQMRLKTMAISYIDPFKGNKLGFVGPDSVTSIARTVHRNVSNYIGDKRQFGREAKRVGIEGTVIPRTFESAVDAATVLGADPSASELVFLKGRFGTAGKEVVAKHTKDLAAMTEGLPKHYIIQEGVKNLALFEGRKYTVRAYLVAHGGALFISRFAFAIIHGTQYDAADASFETQVKHEGYMKKGSKVILRPVLDLNSKSLDGVFAGDSGGEKLMNALTAAARLAGPMFDRIVESTRLDKHRFAIMGIDAIPKADGSVRFIECNSWPNLIHTSEVNAKVNVPMVMSVLRKLFLSASAAEEGGVDESDDDALDDLSLRLVKVWEPGV